MLILIVVRRLSVGEVGSRDEVAKSLESKGLSEWAGSRSRLVNHVVQTPAERSAHKFIDTNGSQQDTLAIDVSGYAFRPSELSS